MNSALAILKRWQAMDRFLCRLPDPRHPGSRSYGLRVRWFAEKWKVTTRTVYRDLEAFKELGQQMEWFHPKGEPGEILEERDYSWYYKAGVEPLFYRNRNEEPRR